MYVYIYVCSIVHVNLITNEFTRFTLGFFRSCYLQNLCVCLCVRVRVRVCVCVNVSTLNAKQLPTCYEIIISD